MKTTVDIPDNDLKELMRLSGAATKREAIVSAIQAFVRQKRLQTLKFSFGTWNIDTNDEMERGDTENPDEQELRHI